MARSQSPGFAALTIEGGLVSSAMVQKVAAAQAPGQSEADYGLPKGLSLRDELARYFRIGQAHWRDFAAIEQPTLRQTASFTQALLREVFGFSDIRPAPSRQAHGRQFPIALEAQDGNVPVAIAPRHAGLDQGLAELGDTSRRSATLLAQEWLNAKPEFYWGLASSGDRLRLLRDNASFTRPAYVEADLALLFDDEAFADFSVLWLLIHASRFRLSDGPASCWLEKWREAGLKEGVTARDRLRDGFEAALLALGNGFLAHPGNTPLAERLRTGELALPTYYEQLLRLVYRFIFLLAAEDRGLLHLPAARPNVRRLYAEGYSLGRLRDRSVRRSAWDRHHDAWEGLLVTFGALGRGEPRLGLPALGGLFEPGVLPDLEGARLSNAALFEAVYRLAWLKEDHIPTPVNWRDMETEELGSVYESLLELTPILAEGGRGFTFAEGSEARGNARKTSGSYYTPDSLVQVLLDSALDPVLDRAEQEEDPVRALLDLTVIDPACGSGHFLLAAARRIATRLALAETDGVASAADYRHALRKVVRSCIYGVDRNPMAVELAKVALWIESVEPGKPLGFLDANIRCGDALLGVFDLKALEDGIPDEAYKALTGDDKATASGLKKLNRSERDRPLLKTAIRLDALAAQYHEFAEIAEDDIAGLEKRQTAFAKIMRSPDRWSLKCACDAWVAAFLLPKPELPSPQAKPMVPTTRQAWEALDRRPAQGPLAAEIDRAAAEARAFHWSLEFPNVMSAGGFSAVIGNPPWEVMQLSEEEYFAQRMPEVAALAGAARKRAIANLADTNPQIFANYEADKRKFEAANEFARTSGRFDLTARGKINTYALFAELFSGLAGPKGRAGLIVPTGIATDATTAPFFAALIENRRLARLVDFENSAPLFPGVHRSFKFSLLTLGHEEPITEFAFFLTSPDQLAQNERRFTLTPDDIGRINPNTNNAPVFRSRFDADLTAKIYARVPVLIDDTKGAEGNPWCVEFRQGLFNMTSDSGHFRDATMLAAAGFQREGVDWADDNGKRYVPLYEAKMIHQFDHRWATYVDFDSRDLTLPEKQDPGFEVTPRYWVPELQVEDRLRSRGWRQGWLMGWRDITNATNERTVVATVFPRGGCGDTLLLKFPDVPDPALCAGLTANLCSLALDYTARQKIGGTHLKYNIFKQLAVLPPSIYTRADLDYIVPRVLELTYTSHAIAPFAVDLGYNGPPFDWDEDRRAHLRAELDAWYASAYGLTRDELRYVLDPADVMGPDYPSETFRVLKNNEIRQYGEYRTARLVLAAYDALVAQPVATG